MARKIREIMPEQTRTVSTDDTVLRAAEIMRDDDVGDVIVLDGEGGPKGIVTDRDIAVRAVAEGRDPGSTPVMDVCTSDLVTISPDDDEESAARMMREHAVRRLPVVENGRVVGAISIGDLAMDKDSDSALADISAAPRNN